MPEARYLAVDTETTGLDWWGPHEAFLVTASDATEDWVYDLDSVDDRRALVAQVAEATDLLMFNAQFDIHMLVKTGLFTYHDFNDKNVHDVSVLARLTVPREDVNYAYRLKNIADVILGEGASDEETALKQAMYEEGIIRRPTQKNLPDCAYLDLYEVQPELVVKYAKKDTRITWELYWALLERLSNFPLRGNDLARKEQIIAGIHKVWDLERAVQPVVTAMEARGIHLDLIRMATLTEESEKQAAVHGLALSEYTQDIPDFDPDSPKQVADMLVGAGVQLYRTTDNGSLRTDKWALSEFSEHPAVEALQGYRVYTKFLNTYLHPWAGREVLHPGIWTIGTETGRMSSSRPNMQNIPTRSGPKVREALVPRKGMSFAVADYSSIELRVLAYYMNDDDFWNLVLEHDVFLWMGAGIYGTDDQTEWAVDRQALKNATYAILYGAGGPKVAQTIGGGMTPDEGRELAASIKSVLGPPYFKLIRRVKQQVQRNGAVTTICGRRQQIPADKNYVGLNYLIQGTAADIMKNALVKVAASAPMYEAHLLLPVHDEILTEAPTDRVEAWGSELSACMETAIDHLDLTYPLPLKAEAVICHNSYAEVK